MSDQSNSDSKPHHGAKRGKRGGAKRRERMELLEKLRMERLERESKEPSLARCELCGMMEKISRVKFISENGVRKRYCRSCPHTPLNTPSRSRSASPSSPPQNSHIEPCPECWEYCDGDCRVESLKSDFLDYLDGVGERYKVPPHHILECLKLHGLEFPKPQ